MVETNPHAQSALNDLTWGHRVQLALVYCQFYTLEVVNTKNVRRNFIKNSQRSYFSSFYF